MMCLCFKLTKDHLYLNVLFVNIAEAGVITQEEAPVVNMPP